ncbi:MAG: hypothetical protein SO108_01185 [Bacilli bacterium]|nr:hypothetical protein [Bacilli bacterium]
MKKKINNRKVIGTIIGLIIFISCAFYFTYAFYQWKSGNSDVNLTIKDSTEGGECSNGPNVDVSNIGPVLNVSDGVKANFSVKNKSSSSISLTLGLQITSISNPLRVESFKYALYQDTTGNDTFDYSTNPILSGNFSKMSVGDNTLSTTLTVDKESTYSFQFIVYIDGNMENDSSMMNSSLSASITYGDCDSFTKPLSKVAAGSYVKYTGTNGCTGKACEGQNANYVSDSNMGYCSNSSYKFNANGWRVAYVKDGTAYLTSAGSPECMCTSSDGTVGTSCSNSESTAGLPKHIANLNTKALTYCNSTYAYGGKCDSASAWNMADADFQSITGDSLSTAYGKSNYDSYSIINNGGFYWFATPNSSSSSSAFYWYTIDRNVHLSTSRLVSGLRPVLRLQSSVVVTGGSGTYEDPYTITKKITKLSEADSGSYVKYTGNNGCSGKACEGQNANYVSDTDMGYCYESSHKYNANGWRVAYTKDGTAYLTSAGSPECMCTTSNGTAGTNCGSSYDSTSGVPEHLANLNAKALTYCNSTYAYGGKCDSNSAWNMADADFQTITGATLSTAYTQSSYKSYSLINNGGYYWFATPYGSSSTDTFYWQPNALFVYKLSSDLAFGLRPVLRLQSSVIVTGGSGTYEDPYTISNGNTKLSEVAPGSYVKYTGNNGCTGKSCEGQNANYVSDTDMGYCSNSSYKFNANGWRVAYVKNGTAYLTSAGSPECMCTNSNGVAGTSCGSDDEEKTNGLPKHIANLNTKALAYCNSTYAYGGKCDSNSAWNMVDADFQAITGDTLSTAFQQSGGYYDSYSLINNGGYYWFATSDNSAPTFAFYWAPSDRLVNSYLTRLVNGLRPVLRLASSVVVTGGTGTYKDPYIISNG